MREELWMSVAVTGTGIDPVLTKEVRVDVAK